MQLSKPMKVLSGHFLSGLLRNGDEITFTSKRADLGQACLFADRFVRFETAKIED